MNQESIYIQTIGRFTFDFPLSERNLFMFGRSWFCPHSHLAPKNRTHGRMMVFLLFAATQYAAKRVLDRSGSFARSRGEEKGWKNMNKRHVT